MAVSWTTPAAVRESAGKKVAGWLSGYVAGAEFEPVRFPIRGPAAAELGARYDEARRWAADWDRAARGPLRVAMAGLVAAPEAEEPSRRRTEGIGAERGEPKDVLQVCGRRETGEHAWCLPRHYAPAVAAVIPGAAP